MKYKKTLFWEIKENTIGESRKYSSRTEFHNKSHGAYTVAKNNGWLDEMAWLNRKNIYNDPVDFVYRYFFKNENAIYVGRTIYPETRDKQHRNREQDTVYRFSKEKSVEIPEMEILEEGLTVLQGAEKEKYWEKYYRDNGYTIINMQPCGSLGHLVKGKWSKNKCFEEGKKYKTRHEFQHNSSQAFHVAKVKGWIDEMVWLPKKEFYPKGYWNIKEHVMEEAKKYKTITEFQKNSGSAFNASRRHGYINEMHWFKRNGKNDKKAKGLLEKQG